MIHIIIFAIFMSIFHTDAAEGPDNRVWFTGETVASNCRALKDNLEHCGLVVAESALFQVFAALSQRDFFQNASPVLQVDVEVLLHVLRKESETCPYQLAQRFYHNHCDAIYSQIILHLGQCVPKIDIYDEDIQKILACFPKVLKRDAIKANIERRYQKQNSERLSPSLKHALFTMFLESEYKGLEHDKHFVEVLSWLKGESAQTYYGTLTANLARQRFAVECSPMLEVCGALSQSDFFQKVDLWLKVDINILLHFLCEESGKNPEKLASSFREKDSQVREMKEGEKTILYVFGQCVSEVQTDDLKRMLKCLPKILGQRSFIKRRILRRYQKVGAERFSEELQNTLFKWKMTAESDHQDPESTHQGRPSDAGAVSSASDEERPWLKEKSAQEHCGMLEAQLRQKAMTVENSSMLFLCRELSRHDCDLDTNFLVRTDIKTVLYLLCQKSLCQKIEMPSDELAEIFRKEDDKLNQREMLHALCQPVPKRPPRAVKDVLSEFSPQAVREMLHALGRSVPQMQPQAVKDVLSDFLSQAVIDTYFTFPGEKNRHKILEDIKKRYTEKKDAERFQPLLDNILALVESDEEGEEPCPEIFGSSSMSSEFVQPCSPPMQSGAMVYLSAYQSPQPFPYSMSVALVQPCFPPMQSGAMVYPSEYQSPQPFPYSMSFALMQPCSSPMQSAVAYQHPMNAAVMKSCSPPPQVLQQQMRGAVMNPACAHQLSDDRYRAHLIAYVCRGVDRHWNINEPYMRCAFSEEKIDISDELPKMLDRISYNVKPIPRHADLACMHNVQLRLHEIKKHITSSLTPHQKALLFVWAFAMERRGYRAFTILGFFREAGKNIHYIWTACRSQLPNYLYTFTECTNVERYYGSKMRMSKTYAAHKHARRNLSPYALKESWADYRVEWRKIATAELDSNNNPMTSLFTLIFPDGDAPDARWKPVSDK